MKVTWRWAVSKPMTALRLATHLFSLAGAGIAFVVGLTDHLRGQCCVDVLLWLAAAVVVALNLAWIARGLGPVGGRRLCVVALVVLFAAIGWAFLGGLGYSLTGPGDPVWGGMRWGEVLWLAAGVLLVPTTIWSVRTLLRD